MKSGELHKDISALRAQIVRLCIEEQELAHIVGPNLRRIHLVALGALELRRMRAECNSLRLRRHAELLHEAVTTLRAPDPETIVRQLDHEFAAWQQRIRTYEAEVNAATRVLGNLMTDSDESNFKDLHRALVEKLHPELNSARAAAQLWPRVIAAHARHDTSELRALEILAREIPAPDAAATPQEQQRLANVIHTQINALAKLREQQPHSLEPFLADNDWVRHRREEIEAETRALEARVAGLEQQLAQLLPVVLRVQPFGKN